MIFIVCKIYLNKAERVKVFNFFKVFFYVCGICSEIPSFIPNIDSLHFFFLGSYQTAVDLLL